MALGLLTMIVMAVPTDIIDTPWFSREVPVRWWEYPTLVAIGVLTALWFAIPAPQRGAGTAVGGVTLATFAIGCAVCNKLVLAAVGTLNARQQAPPERWVCGHRCSRCWRHCRSR